MFKRFFSKALLRLLGWRVNGEFPEIKKSVVIFAPHTSYLEVLIGKLYLMYSHVKYKIFIKKTFFWFPFKYLIRFYGGIPVQNVVGKNAVFLGADLIEESESMHIVISPEGSFSRKKKWNRGFLVMAKRANVPVLVAYMDFKKKEVGVKGICYDLRDENEVIAKISNMYCGVTAKCPERFSIENIK